MQLEHHSDMETESEEGTTASEDDTFLSIWYPALLNFPTAYLHNWDFIDSMRVKKYLMKHFHIEAIRDSLCSYPNHLNDLIYYNMYIRPDCFNQLQCFINQSIVKHNAFQKWSEHIARYCDLDSLNPLLITCIL